VKPYVILSAGSGNELELLKTRSLLLKRQGYVVASVNDLSTALALFTHTDFRFDLLILSHTIEFADRNRLAEVCKESSPQSRVLVLVPRNDCDPLADACVDPMEGPEAFLKAVASLLKKSPQVERRSQPRKKMG